MGYHTPTEAVTAMGPIDQTITFPGANLVPDTWYEAANLENGLSICKETRGCLLLFQVKVKNTLSFPQGY